MGNQITREYDVDTKRVVATGGPGFCWRVYNATNKTTGRRVAVFIFEKKLFADQAPRRRGHVDHLVALLKRDIAVLSRLRHPCLLEIAEPLAESPTTLAFATEPIMGNLANVLGNYSNFTTGIDRTVETYELDELEIQKGVLQLARALEFCHHDAKLVHSNLVPEAVWINSKGDWKLGGFFFSQWNQYGTDQKVDFPEYNAPLGSSWLPNLDFGAPEAVIDQRPVPASDAFALGCLIHALHHQGRSLIQAQSNILAFKTQIERLSVTDLPPGIQQLVADLVKRSPDDRIALRDLPQHAAFQSPLLVAVRFLDTLPSQSTLDRAQFFKSLATLVPKMPTKLVKLKLVPALVPELRTPSMAVFVLPPLMAACLTHLTPRDVQTTVVPALAPLLLCTDPPHVVQTLLANVPVLIDRLPNPADVSQVLVPLFSTALDMAAHQAVQANALTVLKSPAPRAPPSAPSGTAAPVLAWIEYAHLKTVILPRIARFLAPDPTARVSPTVAEMQASALLAIRAATPLLDRGFVADTLLPTLRVAAAAVPPPASGGACVASALVGVYHDLVFGPNPAPASQVGNAPRSLALPVDVVVAQVIPTLYRVAYGPAVASVAEFREILTRVRAVDRAVEAAHAAVLAQGEAMSRASSSVVTAASVRRNAQGEPELPPLDSIAASSPRAMHAASPQSPITAPVLRPTPVGAAASAAAAAAAQAMAARTIGQMSTAPSASFSAFVVAERVAHVTCECAAKWGGGANGYATGCGR
ncbi:SCY1 protein kinase [Allomyces macrogynus ATCC 38327]|uniref:SCY1 protein kinase n=1 Tax=Allomyces macrogynus (strain ATCC 38327) TaxID=578462 RepID=A0A0L0SF11_ALLM3|nr:SCY1 protein kinase [Allomyces macrogynus ATCC 38327]|eukprot:KNE61128.1 SCY1 protein kinase [Allomyces macrogynus ATCC 38327]